MSSVLATALLLALQTTPGDPGDSLRIRAGDRSATVPLVETNGGLAVRAASLAPLLSGAIVADSGGQYVLRLAGVEVRLAEQIPFASIGGAVVPLAAAPFRDGDGLHVPLHLVAELLPRYATGVSFDVARVELRVPGSLPRAVAEVPAATTRPVAAPASGPAAAPRRPAGRSAPRPANRKRVIVVDAGHGGTDPGMRGPYGRSRKIREKDVTLAVARQLRTLLQQRGYTVVMTRTTDTLIALSDRGRIANRAAGDLFLSIHVNAANPRWRNPGAARGFETYFLAEAKTEDAKRVEEMENESVRFETGVNAPDDDPLSFIINDMAQNEHLRKSSELAVFVQTKLAGVHPSPNRGVKQAGFKVLVTAYMPAVLIEIGFGTNPTDADFVASAAGQRKLADAIADATQEYLEHYERRVQANAAP
ncbi:MAG TPA: N-acetylmuramoyl-L-alanine amidase [Gemmatimonadaceae bacterium]